MERRKFKVINGIRVDDQFVGFRKGKITLHGHRFRIGKETFVVAECDCGNANVVYSVTITQARIKATSCGCAKIEFHRKRLTKHSNAIKNHRTPEYRAWESLQRRCYVKSDSAYKYYGKRGIRVFSKWRGNGGFQRFLAHIGPKPSHRHSIDRIDGEKGYEPGNVRWADRVTQSQNRSCVKKLKFYGETKTIREWSEISGIPTSTIRRRLLSNWPEKQAVWAPISDTGCTRLKDVIY